MTFPTANGAGETRLFNTDTPVMEELSPPHHFAVLMQTRLEDALKLLHYAVNFIKQNACVICFK